MKKLMVIILVVTMLAMSTGMAVAGQGNYAPTGRHYNLNIIGVPRDKAALMEGNQGHRIFVKLSGNSKIWLFETPDEVYDFEVLDANGTDGDGAAFQLPNPDPDDDGVTVYSVWARALGKLHMEADMTTCAYAGTDGLLVCSGEVLELVRTKKAKFQNVSRELLFIYYDLDGDGTPERYALFDDALHDYFWNYDNRGLKLVQLRFYEIPTDVN